MTTLITLMAISIGQAAEDRAADVYVALNGNDAWSGTLASPNEGQTDGPFATLERARDEIRQWKTRSGRMLDSITVHIRGGDYVRDKPFELQEQDSGSASMPITYRAYKDETVRLLGGRPVRKFEPVTDPKILERFDKTARDKIMQADLKAAGITDFGHAVAAGKRLELFCNGKPMTLARWPNDGFTKIKKLVGGKPHKVHGLTGDKVGKFTYEGDRPERWKGEDDIWLHGYWFWDWADAYQQVESIDTDKKVISTVPPYHHYGYRAGQRYYAVNLLSEIDTAGEWYVDRESGMLYFWPPTDLDESEVYVSVIETLIAMHDVSHVTVRGLTLEFNRKTAVWVEDGSHVQIAGCTLRNIGGKAVVMTKGEHHGVIGCDIHDTGDGGISLSGGDRETLTPGNHYAVNNHIHDYSRTSNTYRTAVSVAGVGCRVANNLMHDAPHMAIGLSGNEHVIEYNEVHTVCMDTDDAGAFYMGRDWTWRGNRIRYNYFHHIGSFEGRIGVQAIYMDDWASDTTVYGNILYKVPRAILLGGGRDTVIENNVILDCNIGVHVDSRGLGWAKYYFDDTNNTLIERLNKMPYRKPPWSERYPELLTLYEDEPAVAKYNTIARNVIAGCKKPIDLLNGLTDEIVTIKDNRIEEESPFTEADLERLDLKFDERNSPSGFERIPTGKIGLYPDELRASPPPKR